MTSKFRISKQVEFAGATLSAELVQGKKVVDILPQDGYINALKNLKRPEIKKKNCDHSVVCCLLCRLRHQVRL